MGVIQNLKKFVDEAAAPVVIEDILEDVSDEASVHAEEPLRRNRNRNRTRVPVRAENTTKPISCRWKSGKKYRRYQHTTQLMDLVEGENELHEVSIYDFISPTVSPFTQLLMEKEDMQTWNNFINCTDDDQWAVIDNWEKEAGNYKIKSDSRAEHPAVSAKDCFAKIDSDLRAMLKKRHVPLGDLYRLEQDISSYFTANPTSIRRYHLPNSFQRLMVHALCQYMDLCSNSYDKDGTRWTKIQNHCPVFSTPAVLLSAYLEQRFLSRSPL